MTENNNQHVDRDVDLSETGGLATQMTAVSRTTKRTVRERIPERYRSFYGQSVSAAGTVLAVAALAFALFVLLRTCYYVVGPLVGTTVPSYQYTATTRILQFIILALAWDLIGGQTGYASFGNIAFFGMGAYVVGVMMNGTVGWLGTHGFLVAFATAGVVGLAYGLVVGYPLLRLRGHYFAVATLGLLLATQQYVANLSETGGGSGLTLPVPEFSNIDRTFFLAFFALAVVTIVAYWYLTRVRFGAGLNAIRDDEGKARAMGLDTTRYKIVAWGVSGLFTALAGGLFAYQNAFIAPTVVFSVDWTVFMILMALVGGTGRLWGPVIGAALLWEIRNVLWSNGPAVQSASEITGIPLNEVYLIIFGLVLIVFVIGAPEGLLGYLEDTDLGTTIGQRFDGTPVERFVSTPESTTEATTGGDT